MFYSAYMHKTPIVSFLDQFKSSDILNEFYLLSESGSGSRDIGIAANEWNKQVLRNK